MMAVAAGVTLVGGAVVLLIILSRVPSPSMTMDTSAAGGCVCEVGTYAMIQWASVDDDVTVLDKSELVMDQFD